jgi:ABC-2 type transport system ATP-binding protein
MNKTGLMIEAIQLRRSFKEKAAVSGVWFRMYNSKIFGLIGPNGAGKTTTIHLLTGQIDPNSRRATLGAPTVSSSGKYL